MQEVTEIMKWVKYLVEYGSDINKEYQSDTITPLFEACI